MKFEIKQGQPELVLIHRTVKIEYNQSNGDLIIQSGKIYKLEDFNDGERAELEQIFGNSQMTTATSTDNQKTSFYLEKEAQWKASFGGNDKDNGKGKIFGILGIIAILIIGGVVVIRKQFKKKTKK